METVRCCFGRNVQYIRQKRELTQKHMAAVLGVSVSTLRRIEKEEATVRITGRMVCRFCDAYGLSADVVLQEDMTKQEGRP